MRQCLSSKVYPTRIQSHSVAPPTTEVLRPPALSVRFRSANATGQPSVSIAGSFRVLDDEHLMFADIASPRTVANLEANPQVCGIVFDPANRHGCRVWGTAAVLSSGELFDKMNADLAARKMQARHVVVITVNEFTTF